MRVILDYITSNSKLWDTVHNNRDNILFRLLPDIAMIVEFVEYVG